MKRFVIFGLSILGIVAGLTAAYIFARERKPQPPAFAPMTSPYAAAIYANGIVESEQDGGSNVSIYPEVPGAVAQVGVHEGQVVAAGTTLITLDDSVQRATTEQLRLQAEAARAVLAQLKAQPRREQLAVARAQVDQAEATLRTASNQYDKRRASFAFDANSISKDVLDTSNDAVRQAGAARDVALRQYELLKAGTWSYDLVDQQKQVDVLQQTYLAARAQQQKYTITAKIDGVVLAVNASIGSYVSPQGTFDANTQVQLPLVVMSSPQKYLAVRCYIDEILVSRLPRPENIRAQMSIRGTDVKVPLEFVRVQPYMTPKIALSNQRQERVDLRVLPVVFRFRMTTPTLAYPGQLVDVFIGSK